MIGQTVGQYKIQEQLGKGGMGVVYKAHDTRLDRTVALKFLPPHLSADENSKQRFMQEARAASALDHANICTIHEIGEADDGQLYIVMSFYDGQTLKYKLENGKLSVSDAVATAHQIASGLARAHEAGIVHRDIKPANIMVTNRGEVKILDFGVAKLSESSELTKTGSTIGTAAYMSPEQAKGETVDFSADIWSVGILLYEMLTGQRPFEGGYEAAMVYAIVNQDQKPPHELVPEIPVGISEVVARCLAKSRSERYTTANELVSALDPFISTSGTITTTAATAVPVSASERTTVPSLVRVGGAFLLVAVVVLAIVYAGMIGFGLPDWVFQIGVVLMAAGLPILLYAAHSERTKAGPSWLSFKKAVWGGVFAISGLSIVTAAFMLMRALGIGPAATLQSSGALGADAKLIVAEFENSTSDETLSESVSELLRIDLSQSDAINVMDGAEIVSVLSRMNRDADAKIDLDTAMEIAAREGAEAVVAGAIRQLGSGYVLSARLLAAHDGSELVALSESARDDGAIIDAMDKLSANLREEIGESIKTIRSADDLDRVTTSSLDALRLYSQGVAATDAGDHTRSLELLNQAVDRDSTFAMAYRKLSVVYNNSGRAPELRIASAAKAFQLRNRLPARERGLATAYYYAEVEVDRDKRVLAYENLIEQFPDETAALNNVAIDYLTNGEFEKAEEMARRALAIGNRDVYYGKLIQSLTAQKRFAEAEEAVAEFDEEHPGHPQSAWFHFNIAMVQGRYEGADSLIRSRTLSDDVSWELADAANRLAYNILQGQVSASENEVKTIVDLNQERDTPGFGLLQILGIAYYVLDVLGDSEKAKILVDGALDQIPLETMHPYARPYSDLVQILIRLGDTERAQTLWSEYLELVPEGVRNGNFDRHAAEAEFAIADNRLQQGLDVLRRVHTLDKCAPCYLYREAQILEQMDSLDAAAATYARLVDDTNTAGFRFRAPAIAPSYFRLGELHSRLGNTDEAIEAYSQFVDLWQNADSELQPQVAYARDRIGRLLDQKTREGQ